MAVRKYANNAASTLSAAITNSQTGLTLASGGGASFPSLSGSDWFIATLDSGAGTVEVIKVTARATDYLTIVRAQESTSASAFSSGAAVQLRATAASFQGSASLPAAYVAGDVLYASNTTSLTTLAIGAANRPLTSTGSAPQWAASLPAATGGTGQTTYTKGDLIYASSSAPTLAKLAIGSANQVLTVSSGLPAWGASPSTFRYLPIAQADLPDSSGTGNNPPEIARIVVSTTQTANTPKRTKTYAKFDAATDEHLEWSFLTPSTTMTSPSVRLVWQMNTATGSRTVWKVGAGIVAVGAANTTKVFIAATTGGATNGTTANSTRSISINVTTTGIAVNRPITVFVGRDADAGSDTATGDAILMDAQLEWT